MRVVNSPMSALDAYQREYRRPLVPTADPVNNMFIYLCTTDLNSYKQTSTLYVHFHRKSVPRVTATNNVLIMFLMLCGDIELNPGPRTKLSDQFPCGYCSYNVNWSDRAVCCDECEIWYHKSCHELSTDTYSNLGNVRWLCGKCKTFNFASATFHSYEFDDQCNILQTSGSEDVSISSAPLSPTAFNPQCHSSPTATTASNQRPVTTHSPPSSLQSSSSTSEPLPDKSKNWRVLSLNANSIAGKSAEFANIVEYTKPDVILLQETKLGSETHFSAEFMPPGFSRPKRKDRKAGGGGVLVAVRDCYPAAEVEIPDNPGEVVWVEVSLRKQHKIYLGSFYRPPGQSGGKAVTQIDDLDRSLQVIRQKTKNNSKHTIILGGDFNLGDINWTSETVSSTADEKAGSERLIKTLRDHHLTQLQHEPTREHRTLDLLCTNKPSLVKCITTIPGISDHDALVADCDVKPVYQKKNSRLIHLFSRANWEKMREATYTFAPTFLAACKERSVEENWTATKNHITNIMKQHIPTKMTSSRQHNPWMSNKQKRTTRKKHRLYNIAKKSGKPEKMQEYKKLQRESAKDLKRSHWKFVNNFIAEGFATNNTRPFWKYVKSQRQDNFGIPPLKRDGVLHTDSQTKADIMLDEFKSVFTREDTSHLPQLGGTAYPSISGLTIHEAGVAKLLSQLDPNKASGPDGIPCRVLKHLSSELAPIITALLRQTLDTGVLPEDWIKATISPIYKKGNIHLASNYRPISLTCVIAKIMEHILSTHIRNHLDHHKILTPLQHGFRKVHSCESQLVITLDDLMSAYDHKIHVDVGVLDFSRAFDTVPHERLLVKLKHYGIDGPIHTWIRSFLCNRHMTVAIDGELSHSTQVDSGVPQGTVLGPLLFLLFINDLPAHLSPDTSVRLFADDCLVYRHILSPDDQDILQKDLTSLEQWTNTWGMRFNPAKCTILSISRSRSHQNKLYTLCGEVLQEENEAKYLGIRISNTLDWSSHVGAVAKKGSNTLNFIRRNLKYCPKQSKQMAYFSIVRPTLDYGAVVWDPHLKKHQEVLERVNRRAARFVMNDYSPTSSVTAMLDTLGWPSLEHRREYQRLVFMYKIANGLIAVPSTNLIPADSRTRAQHSFKYRTIQSSTSAYKNSFFPRTIPGWNRLPSEVVNSDTVDSFKANLS